MSLKQKELSKKTYFDGSLFGLSISPKRQSPSISIKVTFDEIVEPETLVQNISHLNSPFVVLWYIGAYGLKRKGVEFYRDTIINPIQAGGFGAKFALVDLSAWAGLKDPNASIRQKSRHTEKLNTIHSDLFTVLNTSDVFDRMGEYSCPFFIDYFKSVFRRKWVHESSKDKPPVGFLTRDAFHANYPIIEDLMHLDASLSYSALQYLEALILIEELVKKSKERVVDIVFALPNDELKYYKDQDLSFQKDLQFFLENQTSIGEPQKTVRVHFKAFSYGEHLSNRPYNAPGDRIKVKDLQASDVVSDMKKHPLDGPINMTLSTCRYHRSLQVQIETPRLIIRNLKEDDLTHSRNLYEDAEITRYFDFGKPKTAEEILKLYREGLRHFKEGNPWGLFSIFSKDKADFLGHVDIFPDCSENALEIGYILHKKSQGQGVATEAAWYLIYKFIPDLIAKGLISPDYTSFRATVHPQNTGSQRVLEKLGMKRGASLIRFGQPRYIYTLKIA